MMQLLLPFASTLPDYRCECDLNGTDLVSDFFFAQNRKAKVHVVNMCCCSCYIFRRRTFAFTGQRSVAVFTLHGCSWMHIVTFKLSTSTVTPLFTSLHVRTGRSVSCEYRIWINTHSYIQEHARTYTIQCECFYCVCTSK